MTRSPHEWKVIPAPRSVRRQRGERDGAEAAARALAEVLAEQAAEGWEFRRAETLPVEERAGLFGGRRQASHALLVFRRSRPVPVAAAPQQAAADPDRAFAKAARPGTTPEAEPPLRAGPVLRPAADPRRADPDPHPDPEAPPAPRLGPADR